MSPDHQEDRDVQTAKATELADPTEIVNFVDDLEELFAGLECELLDTLSPQQFAKVQRLVEAGQVMTEARCMLGVLASVRTTPSPRSTVCRPRRAIRRTATARIRAIGA
jgi:hypothetical protein